jgi:hypothetical protein
LTAAATGWCNFVDTSFGNGYSAQSPRYLKRRETVMSANVMGLERFNAGQFLSTAPTRCRRRFEHAVGQMRPGSTSIRGALREETNDLVR